MQQQRNPATVSQMMAESLDLQNKVNSLSDAREFYDPESGNSSGATHVPDQTSTILSSRILPRCDCGLPRNTQNRTCIMGNVSERPLVQEGQPSAIFHNSKNSASSSQELRHDVTETARKERERKRDSLNAPNQSPHFQGRSGMLNHTVGTSSHGGMMNYPRIPLPERNIGKVPDSVKFQSWKCNFRPGVCLRTADPQVTMLSIKEVVIATSMDELVTSRSIAGQPNVPEFNMLDVMIVSALKKLLYTHSNFRKKVSVEEQRASNSDRFLRGRQIAYMTYEDFRATGAYEAAFVHCEFAE